MKTPSTPKHFLDLDHFDAATLRKLIDNARRMKEARKGRPKGERDDEAPLKGRMLALIFEKPSTRTRISFDMGMRQLGGECMFLDGRDMQFGHGETVGDTARVISRYVDGIVLRSKRHQSLLELARTATVPVINGLTDKTHPCQLMADILTFEEHRGPIAGRRIAWSGDGNNMATSWLHAAGRFGFELRIGCPKELPPPADVVEWARAQGAPITITDDVEEAVGDADCVVTDTWVSMGDTDTADRHNLLAPFRVDARVMAMAKPDAIFMHCLPAHRGEEVTSDVIDGPQSVVWDEAENRLHAQKGILAWCLGAI